MTNLVGFICISLMLISKSFAVLPAITCTSMQILIFEMLIADTIRYDDTAKDLHATTLL